MGAGTSRLSRSVVLHGRSVASRRSQHDGRVNSQNLVPAHNGNASALKHGLHARGELLAPEIAERIADLADLPWATQADRVALEEVGRLLVLIDKVDADLAKRGTSRTKTLLDQRVRLSRALHRWLESLGATPKTRAEWAGRWRLAAEIRAALGGDADGA